MKILRGIITTLWICIGLTSCIQDEPLCPEAEIESFTLPSELLFSDPVINQGQNTIQVLLNKKADLTALTPEVTVTVKEIIQVNSPEPFPEKTRQMSVTDIWYYPLWQPGDLTINGLSDWVVM